jgi:hypothetical protein
MTVFIFVDTSGDPDHLKVFADHIEDVFEFNFAGLMGIERAESANMARSAKRSQISLLC